MSYNCILQIIVTEHSSIIHVENDIEESGEAAEEEEEQEEKGKGEVDQEEDKSKENKATEKENNSEVTLCL